MKQMIKKAVRLTTMLLGVSLLMLSLSGLVLADEMDESTRQQLALTAEGITDTIIEMTDENMEKYSTSTDAFTVSAMEAWKTSRDELGARKTDEVLGEVTVTERAKKYTVSVPRSFEKGNANFVYIFDKNLNPLSITIDVKLPMSTNLVRAALNTLMGICIVFLVLLFLSFIISLLKYIPGLLAGKKKETPAIAAPAPAAAALSVPEIETDDQELIAVIAAAIAAAEGTSADGFVVRSIRKANRRK